ncbi:pirin family protein [Actinospongicola halichondriae]|uniref:pirin family protein n=1 Tax=Actinospongicola halichondriae TaxID=3236844 RepID=UPI003D37501D
MSGDVLQTVALDFQWPTLDPFLFCVHHLDDYPEANDLLGPDAPLTGRQMGSDFDGVDGWRMYHGTTVPGFPQHPHRGFETVTYVRQGLIDHADSMGAAARYGRGDVQWLTAGAGIQHAEMFPLLDRDERNPVELFQIWLNLPAADKMSDPYFAMLWDVEIPRVEADGVTVTVIAGSLGGTTPPSPPPDSYGSKADAEVAIWHIVLEDDAEWTLPRSAGEDVGRVLYLFEGDGLTIGDSSIGARTGAVLDASGDLVLRASDGPVEALVLQGRPIGEPVAQYGPFVMNTKAEIQQAMDDYQSTQFGGWPWDVPDPTHGRDDRRFARRPDGSVEEAIA